jgi:hypothetical protein
VLLRSEPPEATLIRLNSSVIEEKLVHVSGANRASGHHLLRRSYRTRGGESSRLAAERRAPARGSVSVQFQMVSINKAPFYRKQFGQVAHTSPSALGLRASGFRLRPLVSCHRRCAIYLIAGPQAEKGLIDNGNEGKGHMTRRSEEINRCHLPSSESDEPPEEPSLRLKERTWWRALLAEPPALLARSIADIVAVGWRCCDWCWIDGLSRRSRDAFREGERMRG